MSDLEEKIWNLVHEWCEMQYHDIPDANRRYLMDMIEDLVKKLNLHDVSNNDIDLENINVKVPPNKTTKYKLSEMNKVAVCGYFEPEANTTSSTTCKRCGQNKWMHKQTDC